jgi:hypothetical protein
VAPSNTRAASNAAADRRDPDGDAASAPGTGRETGAKRGGQTKHSLTEHQRRHLEPRWRKAPFVLRITEWKVNNITKPNSMSNIDQDSISLETSIVVVGEDCNPSILNPDFLRIQGILPEEWGWEPSDAPLTTCSLSVVVYDSDFTIKIQPNRFQVTDASATAISDDAKIIQIARRYIQVLPHVRYTAVGNNFQRFLPIPAPMKALQDRFIKPGPWLSEENRDIGVSLGYVYDGALLTLSFDNKLLVQRANDESAQLEQLEGMRIKANFHTAAFPVESEAADSMHQVNVAAAASSIFIACRKRDTTDETPESWTGFGGLGVQHKVRAAVQQGLAEFAPLKLNPVDEMVAAYGRALHVLSQHWPVMDGDEQVSPLRAMNEASRVVAEHQIQRITAGRLRVDDLDPETAMALTLYGIYGLLEIPYDDLLTLSKSMNIRLEGKAGGYRIEPGQRFIGINQETTGRRSRGTGAETQGFAAPLARKGSKLRIALPEERDPRRLERPQTDWDRLHGALLAYRRGELPVARQYLSTHAADRTERIADLLAVWAREMDDDKARAEAENLLFGLRSG